MPEKRTRPRRYMGKLARPLHPLPELVMVRAGMVEQNLASYTRENGDPIPTSEHPYIQERDRLTQALVDERFRRLLMLFDFYGIEDKSNFLALAFALAEHHVPGLQIMKARPGAKTKRHARDDVRIAFALGKLMEERGVKHMTKAAQLLYKQPPWSKMAPTWQTLLRRAQSAGKHSAWLELEKEYIRIACGKRPGDPLTLADICATFGSR